MKRAFKFILSLAALFVIASLLYLTFRKDQTHTTTELRAMFETPNTKYFDWRGIDVHYEEHGEGSPVILIHGFGGSFTNWSKTWELFPDSFRLISVDLPGFGLSDVPEFREDERIIDMYVDAIHTLTGTLGLDSAVLVGNSLGGYVSWETAVQYPELVDKLVLVNSAGYDMDEIGGTFINLSRTKLFDWAFQKGMPYRLAVIAARNSVAGKPDKDRIKAFYHLLNRKETIYTLSYIGGSGEVADTTRISEVTAPTLIVWGEMDQVIEEEHAHRFHRDIPGSELIVYKLVAHVPQIESPEMFVDDVVEFLDN